MFRNEMEANQWNRTGIEWHSKLRRWRHDVTLPWRNIQVIDLAKVTLATRSLQITRSSEDVVNIVANISSIECEWRLNQGSFKWRMTSENKVGEMSLGVTTLLRIKTTSQVNPTTSLLETSQNIPYCSIIPRLMSIFSLANYSRESRRIRITR